MAHSHLISVLGEAMIIAKFTHHQMVSFSCEVCNDTIIKKKLDQHKQRCRGAYFTCIDCSTTFQGSDYKSHTQCISEAEKYEKALYKGKKSKPAPKQEPKKEEPKKEEPTKTEKLSKKEDKLPKKSSVDLSQFSSGPLYKVIKTISKDAKLDKKDVLKKLQVKRINGELTLTL